MEGKDEIKIICPHCGQEYLPCEIFIPEDFLGKVRNVVRDDDGKILFYEGDNMNLEESYCCDKCGVSFNVRANVHFEVTEDKESIFDEEYVSSI